MTDPPGPRPQTGAEALVGCLVWLLIAAAMVGVLAGVAVLAFRLLT